MKCTYLQQHDEQDSLSMLYIQNKYSFMVDMFCRTYPFGYQHYFLHLQQFNVIIHKFIYLLSIILSSSIATALASVKATKTRQMKNSFIASNSEQLSKL